MTNIIKQLNDISVSNTYKLHDLLDRVLEIQSINFPNNEIKFDQERVAFVSQVNGYSIIVLRDMNTFTVVSRVVKDDAIAAECVVSVVGDFNERYARMDAEIKTKTSTWFTEIGNIDTSILKDYDEDTPSENEAEPEKVEAEVVSEG